MQTGLQSVVLNAVESENAAIRTNIFGFQVKPYIKKIIDAIYIREWVHSWKRNPWGGLKWLERGSSSSQINVSSIQCTSATNILLPSSDDWHRLRQALRTDLTAQKPPCTLECDEWVRTFNSNSKKQIHLIARWRLPDFWAFLWWSMYWKCIHSV